MSQYAETKRALTLDSALPCDSRHRQMLLYAKAAIEDLEANNAELKHLVGVYEEVLACRLYNAQVDQLGQHPGTLLREIRKLLREVAQESPDTRQVA